jgi:MOSC domain-containing protein YiiM/GNAT superfamily N-acetyltransferase
VNDLRRPYDLPVSTSEAAPDSALRRERGSPRVAGSSNPLATVPEARVVQVNVSPGGVPKRPVESAWVGRLGLQGDEHHDRTEHGGPFRAVCLYSREAIERVRAEGHPIFPGSVGENLTLAGLELSTLHTGDRLAVGERLVLEITHPTNPCTTIRDSFLDGQIARISILAHPLDSRLYARVLVEGAVRAGDPVRVLPPLPDSDASIHALLDRLDANERAAMLSAWRAAAEGGVDVRTLDDGELAIAAAPELPGASFNRAFGLRQLPHLLPAVLAFFARHEVCGWLTAAEPPWPDAVAERTGAVLAASPSEVLEAPSVDGLAIRLVGPAEAVAWERTMVAGCGFSGPLADAWLAAAPGIARDPRMHLFLAEIGGVPVGAGGLFVHRHVGGLVPGCVAPAYRGRGVHAALIAARTRLAAELGCELVAGWATLGGPSERELLRLGLRRVWTRGIYRWCAPAPAAAGEAARP